MKKVKDINIIIDPNHIVIDGQLHFQSGPRRVIVETIIPRRTPDAPPLPDDCRAAALVSIQEQFAAELDATCRIGGIPSEHRLHLILQDCIRVLTKYRTEVETYAERVTNLWARAEIDAVIRGIRMVIDLVNLVACGAYRTVDPSNIQERFATVLDEASRMNGIPPRYRVDFIQLFRILQGCILALKRQVTEVKTHAERAKSARALADADAAIQRTTVVINLVKLVAYGAQLAMRMTNSDLN